MKSAKLSSIIALGLLALVQSTASQAHYLWLEQANEQVRLYFGEYENGIREKSGGRLDTIAMPEVQTNPANGNRVTVAVKRMDDHLAVNGANLGPLISQEINMKVKDLTKSKIGIVKPMYYARLAKNSVESASALDLDIQPIGNNKVRVNLHGKPLTKVKLNIYAPNQWTREYETDAAGEAAVEMPWSGLYVLQVAHIEPVKGEYQGDVYEAVRHVSTLSLSQQ
jgi:uncharacterized GH25 family protein